MRIQNKSKQRVRKKEEKQKSPKIRIQKKSKGRDDNEEDLTSKMCQSFWAQIKCDTLIPNKYPTHP